MIAIVVLFSLLLYICIGAALAYYLYTYNTPWTAELDKKG